MLIPTEAEQAEARLTEYRDNRGAIFGQTTRIGDQLDMLWHDIDNGLFGEQAKTGTWFTAIKAVKDAHPKPDE